MRGHWERVSTRTRSCQPSGLDTRSTIPLPAILVALPLGDLPFAVARSLWAAASAAVFVLAALRYGRGLPVALLSASFLNAVIQGQWSPLLTAAAVVPALSWGSWSKPSIGAALFAAFPNRRAVIGGLLLLGVPRRISHVAGSMDREPSSSGPHGAGRRPPRWIPAPGADSMEEAEARLLAALACVPQTIGLYETLPLFLIPRTAGRATRWRAELCRGLRPGGLVPRLPGCPWRPCWPPGGRSSSVSLLPALVMVLCPGRGPRRSGAAAARGT